MRHREAGDCLGAVSPCHDPIPETLSRGNAAYFAASGSKRSVQDGSKSWLALRPRDGLRIVGDPDQIVERNVNQAIRRRRCEHYAFQFWQYRQYNAQLVFYDEAGSWRPDQTE